MAEEGISAEEFRAANGLAKIPDTSKLPAPKIPVIYEEARRAVAACTDINEAKYWSDKADALAAWAKIYNEDKVSIEAKRLKLHAYRRMAYLADQIMPAWRAERGYRCASVPIILKDYGIQQSQARVIAKIGELPAAVVQRAIARAKPPTPSTLALVDSTAQPDWTRIKRCMSSLVSLTKEPDPQKIATKMPAADRERAHELAECIVGWCYELQEKLEEMAEKSRKRASNE